MSTQTPARPQGTVEQHAPIDPDGAHYVMKADLRIAGELGVEVQALCGFWDFLDALSGRGDGVGLGICPRCKQIRDGLPVSR